MISAPGVPDLAAMRSRSRSQVRQAFRTPGDVPVAICVGRLDGNKDPETVLRCFAAGATETAFLWLCGEGPLASRLEKTSRALGIAGRVRFLGYQPQMADIYGAADLLVHAAKYEAFGFIYVEAMVSGLPVIGPRNRPGDTTSSFEELITEGAHGFAYRRDHPEELQALLGKMLRKPALLAEMGAAARDHALSQFTWEKHADDLESAIIRAVRGEPIVEESLLW